MKKGNPEVIWGLNTFDDEAYNEGLKAWYEHKRRNYISSISNPYETGSNKWYSWNRGWNTLNDIEND